MSVLDLTESRFGVGHLGYDLPLLHAHAENLAVRTGERPTKIRITYAQWGEIAPCLSQATRFQGGSGGLFLAGLPLELVEAPLTLEDILS